MQNGVDVFHKIIQLKNGYIHSISTRIALNQLVVKISTKFCDSQTGLYISVPGREFHY